jgi:hypothetical protein
LRRDAGILPVMPLLAFASVSTVVSVMAGNEAVEAVRFMLVLVATALAFQVRSVPVSQPWVLGPVVLQCAVVVALSVVLAVLQDPLVAFGLRELATDRGWGDIYSYDGIYYRVQVIGNALLPVLFLVCLWQRQSAWFHRLGLVASALGLVAAGNLTYFIVAGLAVALRYRHRLTDPRVLLLLGVPALLAGALVLPGTIQELVELKFEGSDSSMGVRFDQWLAAQEGFERLKGAVAVGAGLGARFPDGLERNYSDFLYIELQALYVTWQVGLLGMTLYLGTLVICSRRALAPEGRAIFWLYMLSGVTNPYILDSNQIVTTMLLVHLFPRRADPPSASCAQARPCSAPNLSRS